MVEMFGSDIFANEQLIDTALALVNRGVNKPLECVGVYEESLIGFYLSIKKYSNKKHIANYFRNNSKIRLFQKRQI